MANSLQKQLLSAGLADAKRAKKVNQQKLEKGAVEQEEAREAIRAAQAAKAERDRELNRQMKEEAERKAVYAQIRQLIEINRIDRRQGQVAYQFVDAGKIKKLYVTDPLQAQLVKGQAAIVRFGDGYELVPAAVASKIAQRDASLIAVLNTPAPVANGQPQEEDPYAAYQIPDDLMW